MKKVFLSLCLLTSSIFAKEVCITNFNKEVCKDFNILPSVIVKTKLSKDELKQKLNKKIKQIAFLENANLFLVLSNDSLSYSKELAKKDFIIYAQANISQKKENNSFKSQNLTIKYNLKNTWETTKGEGVKIAIIDDGFDLTHEDLIDTKVAFSYDADNKTLNSNPKLKLDTHGTKVAGIIFAQHNDKGIDGIAPNAQLIAIRQTTNITSDTIISFFVAKKAGANIINCSWNSPILLEPVYDVIKNIAKDTAIVFSAGNNHKEILPLSIESSIPEVITVGTDKKYSNYGEVVDFIMPTNIQTTKQNNTYGNFGGTSASAPIFSGLLALEISKNKGLSIKEIINELKLKIKHLGDSKNVG